MACSMLRSSPCPQTPRSTMLGDWIVEKFDQFRSRPIVTACSHAAAVTTQGLANANEVEPALSATPLPAQSGGGSRCCLQSASSLCALIPYLIRVRTWHLYQRSMHCAWLRVPIALATAPQSMSSSTTRLSSACNGMKFPDMSGRHCWTNAGIDESAVSIENCAMGRLPTGISIQDTAQRQDLAGDSASLTSLSTHLQQHNEHRGQNLDTPGRA